MRASISAFAILFLGLSLQTTLVAAESVTFDKTKFVLAYAPKDSPVDIREYLPEGETLEKWTLMLSSRVFKKLNDPEAYAEQLAKQVTESDPNARSQIFRSDKTGAIVVDFLVFSPAGSGPRFAEWNLMRVAKRPKGGLLVTQYAHRFYSVDNTTAKTINADRDRLLPLLDSLKLPE